MVNTVDQAFSEFMTNTVNLDFNITKRARESKDNLLENIAEFSGDNTFFNLCTDFNIQFGSFARRTKCRDLDDIDLMIGICGDGATYSGSDPWDNVRITPSKYNQAQIDCINVNGCLDSVKVVNKFKKKLEKVREYSRSEIKRQGEAVVLNLISKDWVFDIVPCFQTSEDSYQRTYYLIPNGKGNWKKTDPRIDRDRIQKINQKMDGRVLDLIRLVKRWNKTKNTKTIPSYLLEALIANYCDNISELTPCIDINFYKTLYYISGKISLSVMDPKGIQGNINSLEVFEKEALAQKAYLDYSKALEAFDLEMKDKDHKKSINKWREIFGSEFPQYE